MRNRATQHATALTSFLVCLLAVFAFAPAASAFKVISELGEGAGQTGGSAGLAVDFETGHLYAADPKNNRIDVFDATGNFVKAFGWGVKNGASEFQVCTNAAPGCKKGLAGAGKGQFSAPREIAVDNDPASPSHHYVYVADTSNNRIEKFDPEGNFVLTFGGGVNKTKVEEGAPKAERDVCPVDPGDVCGVGSNGFGEGEFSSASFKGILIGVGPGGTVYVVDSTSAGSGKYRLQKFSPSGALIPPQCVLFEGGTAWATAVDSTGDFHVSNGVSAEGIRKYAAICALIGEIEKPFEELRATVALAIDDADNLFAASSGSGPEVTVMQFDPDGNRLRRFGYGSFPGFAFAAALAPYQSASGDIYASEGEGAGRILHLDAPPPGPLLFPEPCKADPLGNTKATLKAEVNPEGKSTTAHFQYVDEESFETEGGFSSPKTKTTPESEPIGSDFTLHKASVEASLVPQTEYRCRAVATNADGATVGQEGSFTSLPPLEIGSTFSSDVEIEAATLNATVNPLGIPTTGFFEYVDEATYQKDIAELGPEHGFEHAIKAPAGEEIDFGAGESFKAGSASIAGLKAGTAYRFRIVATDPYFPAGFPGPTQTLRTYRPGEGALPDDRAYELVSPAQKNSAEVFVPDLAGGIFLQERSTRIQAAASSGEAVTYTSWTSFGEAKSAPSSSQYLSKRTASGWGTENISPFGFLDNPVEPPYRGFSADLRFAAFMTSEPPLTPQAQAGLENLYLRDSATGELRALTIETPVLGEGQGFCTGYAGSSEDGSRAIFAAKGAMAEAPTGKGFNLYEWSAGEGLQLVSVLPDETPAPPVVASEIPGNGNGTGFGAVGGNCSMTQGAVRNAISKDGSVIFWTYGGKYKSSEEPLFARIEGAETVQLDAKPESNAGKGPFGQGRFWAATGDGEKAFFTAPGKLTKDSEATGQLYRYDTEARSLLNLTPGTIAPEIEGVIGASEDGAYIYFVAKGALTGEQEGPAKQKAAKDAHNLYLWHEGEGVRFIAALAGLDDRDWEWAPARQSARVTPDGRHLAFLTIEAKALSGYDNTVFPGAACQVAIANKNYPLAGDPRCAEAYLYDAEADELTCASCNPSGARPAGPAELPFWTNPYEGPRYLSDDGQRLFFETRDPLSGADQNGKRDVYEFAREGAGTCGAQSPTFDPISGGCISLISSGKSEDHSYLLDASSSGRDVFFSTRSALTGWDENENFDVYDARKGGGFPEPPPLPPICEAEACKPPPVTPPSAGSSPGTATFQGAGNAVEKRSSRCPKGKVRRKARCVKRHGKSRQRKGKAQHKGRAGR